MNRAELLKVILVSLCALPGCDDTSKAAADKKADTKSKDAKAAATDEAKDDVKKGDGVVEAGAAGKAVQGGGAGPVPGM